MSISIWMKFLFLINLLGFCFSAQATCLATVATRGIERVRELARSSDPYGHGSKSIRDLALSLMSRSGNFKRGLDWSTRENLEIGREVDIESLTRLMVRYYDDFFSRYLQPGLYANQSSSLLASLRHRGYFTTETDGYAALKALSETNLQRILDRTGLNLQERADQDIEDYISQLDLFPFRDALEATKAAGPFVISSRQITLFGFAGGRNSQEEFNRSYLQSDDNVFFFLEFSDGNIFPPTGHFGGNRRHLNREYASNSGWVSPRIMLPTHLVGVARAQFSERLTREEMEQLEFSRTKTAWRRPNETEKKVLRLLHESDFTYGDLKALLQAQLRRAMTEYKLNPLAAEAKYGVEAAKFSFSPSFYSRHFKNLIFDPLSLCDRWELKIPAAIPSREFMEEDP